jgi:hypothetical protein
MEPNSVDQGRPAGLLRRKPQTTIFLMLVDGWLQPIGRAR